MLIQQLLQKGQRELERHNIVNADIDALLLLGHCLQMSRTEMLLHGANEVDENNCESFNMLIQRRVAREPVAYILQEREFWSLSFYVNPDVLIPRPETEFLLETVLHGVKQSGKTVSRCVDLCCGSGVIGVVLARELGCQVTALDLSVDALRVTAINARRHGVEGHVNAVCSNLFTALGNDQVFSLIVANPPYVSSGEIKNSLQAEVAEFEPLLALDGGMDGLDCIHRIAREILNYLEPDGQFFMEFGADQARRVVEIFQSVGVRERFFETLNIFQDYSGRDRVLAARVNSYQE